MYSNAAEQVLLRIGVELHLCAGVVCSLPRSFSKTRPRNHNSRDRRLGDHSSAVSGWSQHALRGHRTPEIGASSVSWEPRQPPPIPRPQSDRTRLASTSSASTSRRRRYTSARVRLLLGQVSSRVALERAALALDSVAPAWTAASEIGPRTTASRRPS